MPAPEPTPIEQLPVGKRIQYHRERAGKSRPVVAALVDKSPGWLKAVENGRLLPPRLPVLNRLAAAINVPVTALLDEDLPGEAFAGPGHAALPAVRDAVIHVPLVVDSPPQPLDHLRARLDTAWRARHASPDHRTVLGTLLPGLIRDAQIAARSYAGREREQANAILADTLGLTQMFVAYQPDAGLLWRVSDRAVIAAQESGDLHALAGAVWFSVEALRDSGDWDSAMVQNLDALRAIELKVAEGDGGRDLLAMFGSLHTLAALTAARAGEEGRAWRHWDTAHDVVQRLPLGYSHPHTWFSRPVVGFYALSVAVELQKGGEAIRQARRVDPEGITSRPRRARHLIEVARGYRLKADHATTLDTLEDAYRSAPETIRFNGYARQMTAGIAEEGPAELRGQARDLAVRLGLPM
jgi:transcriptional regulator with XRE-family HTH domain